jgi:hypothetical protein
VPCALPDFEDGFPPEDPPEAVDDFECPELFDCEELPPVDEEFAGASL